MAIVFTTGTINQADTPSVGLAMAVKIRDDVVAHPAWDLVEEFTPAGGAVCWYVFKCLATESLLPADFFVVMGRQLANGQLYFMICEQYDSVTHTMSFFGPIESASSFLYDGLGRRTETQVLGTIVPNGIPAPKQPQWVPSGTSTKWWLTVSEDGFTVAFNGAANAFVHAGAYIPLSYLPIAMPIQIHGSSQLQGAITRNPSVAGLNTLGYALAIDRTGFVLGFAGDLRYDDKLQNNQRPVAERAITLYQNNLGASITYGYALGKQKRIRVGSGAPPPGFAFGDAYAMSGRLWVPYLPADLNVWDTGVLA